MLRSLFSIGLLALSSGLLPFPVEAGGERESKGTTRGNAIPAEETATSEVENAVYLGIFTVPTVNISRRVKTRLRLKEDAGVVIVEVLADSPAEKAGLRHADVITRVNGKTLSSQEELSTRLKRLGSGAEVTFSIRRAGRKQDVIVQLEEVSVEVLTSLRFGKSGGATRAGTDGAVRQRERIRQMERDVSRLEKRVREMEKARRP